MVDVVSIGVNAVIDHKYKKRAQLTLLGLFLVVSAATAVWFIFPVSQNVLVPFLLPAVFLFFTLSMGYYMFIFSCEEKSLVKNVLGMVEPAESVKRVHCQENIKSLLAEVRSTTKDRFCNVLVNLCFEDRSKAHKLALYVKEIDDIVSSIKNKDLLKPVHNLLRSKAVKARTTICRLVLSFRSQFFHNLLHFSNQAKERSTTHLLGNTTKECNSFLFTTSTVAPIIVFILVAKFSPV